MMNPFSEDEAENFLQSLKLCKYEAGVYLTLLKKGPQDYKGLVELSEVPYGKVYSTCNSLAEKGWIGEIDQRPKIFYAVDPETPLKEHLMRVKKRVNELEESLKRLTPQLKTLYDQSHRRLPEQLTSEIPVD